MKTRITVAICTPLSIGGELDVAGLEAHIEDIQRHHMSGLLVAGTMGLMQLQTDVTYRNLLSHAVRVAGGRSELMVGVGDTSFARTCERIQIAQQYAIDGVVVLSPYLVKFSQAELIDYFLALANYSSKPIYMYDLPGLTGTRLEIETVLTLSKHANIRGIKCSGAWEETRQLIDRAPESFRVIPAQPHLVDQLIRSQVRDNLDGIFGIAPGWTSSIVDAAESNDWGRASEIQQKLSKLLHLLRNHYTVFGGCEIILNARGVPGRLTPAPMSQLTEQQKSKFLLEPLVRELLSENMLRT